MMVPAPELLERDANEVLAEDLTAVGRAGLIARIERVVAHCSWLAARNRELSDNVRAVQTRCGELKQVERILRYADHLVIEDWVIFRCEQAWVAEGFGEAGFTHCRFVRATLMGVIDELRARGVDIA